MPELPDTSAYIDTRTDDEKAAAQAKEDDIKAKGAQCVTDAHALVERLKPSVE